MIKIYSLEHPITKEIRYVGKTSLELNERLRSHIKDSFKSNRNYKNATWIRSLVKKGLKPIIQLIEEVSEINWENEEKFYISYFRFLGFKLNNMTEGGEYSFANVGRKWTDEQRKKLIIAFSKPRLNKENFGIKKKVPIIQYDLNGNFIKEHLSALDAYKETKIWKESIRNCINGRSKTAGKFIWKYKYEKIKKQ